ncbi:Carboxylesterase 1C [Cercospora beticola]|uniref:Carboxylesterase 1C n=1 Tax=Cercospora beticola TaxID=122368 RepID=A0A2G5HJY1_CERBT|nr:Carboxylesterase 1C [Cercospora beticola]PIA92877.1 Carboxylesterase 1C [Cercospora beticola]
MTVLQHTSSSQFTASRNRYNDHAYPRNDPQPTVTISKGVVIGTATGVLNQPFVTGLANAYLGIPFARSPPTRFSPPVASDPCLVGTMKTEITYCRVVNLSVHAAPGTGTQVGDESEDCLYLNIFSSRNASPENLKAVLFWLYGGNLILGSISDARYNGSSLAMNEDVVVVAANYRTNLFGFSNSPEIPAGLRNSGFLDQRFALQWVQENIAAFGGDPSRVTIFDESAGGHSVKQLLANPLMPLPYHGAILQSQASNNIGDGVLSWNEVVADFGCDSASSSLDCLREVPATDLQAFITEENLQFPPDEDNITHTNNALPNIISGKFAQVPILIGTNRDEGRLYTGSIGVDNVDVLNRSSVVGWIQDYVMVNISTIIDELYLTYAEAILSDAFLLISQIQTDLLFNCPTKALSEALVSARQGAGQESHVWRYRYDAEFPNLEIFPRAGAYHSSEVPIVFGTYPGGNATNEQRQLSAELQAIWAGMGRNPSAGPGWTEVFDGEQEKDLAIIGAEANATGLCLTDRRENDAACEVFRPLLEELRKLY